MTGLYHRSSHSAPDVTRLTTSSASSVHHHHPTVHSNSNTTNNNARFDQTPLTTFFVVPEGAGSMTSSKPSRARRKSAPGTDPVKHRRTRSGCFTCRTRRVKCDETHPICERCQKGGRECTYPEIIPSSKPSGAQKHKRDKPSSRDDSSSLDELEEEDEEYDDKPSPASAPRLKTSVSLNHLRTQRRDSWPTELGRRGKNRKTVSSLDPSPSPGNDYIDSSTPTSPAESLRRTASFVNLINSPEWASIPHDIAFYLNYHQQMLTCHHYLLKADTIKFFKSTLLSHALNNEALMYAVAAFSAFHYSVQHKTGVFQTFLEYYNMSVGLLRVSLDQPHTLSTLLTILQLASFEEYLGDWVNLMEHRNAATKILTTLWNAQSMAETAELRMVFYWFAHFDVLVAMMSGHSTTVSKEWTDMNHMAVRRMSESHPDNIIARIEVVIGQFRDLAMRTSILTAQRTQGAITVEEFMKEGAELMVACRGWWENIDATVVAGAEDVQIPPCSDPEEACPFKPAKLHKGIRWAMNFMILDYYGLIVMLKHQMALTNELVLESDMTELGEYAIQICSVLAAIDSYTEAPAGALLAAQAPLGMAALWLPSNRRYRRWIQKQLAKTEQMGFVYPLAFRTRISELWNDPQLKNTWVMSNTEPAMSMSIRQLVDMRDSEYPTDTARHDLKEMRALLCEMRIDSKGSGSLPQHRPVSAASSVHDYDHDHEMILNEHMEAVPEIEIDEAPQIPPEGWA
ncbi:hypothetical protein RUND412_000921 [Rhizina undulata]